MHKTSVRQSGKIVYFQCSAKWKRSKRDQWGIFSFSSLFFATGRCYNYRHPSFVFSSELLFAVSTSMQDLVLCVTCITCSVAEARLCVEGDTKLGVAGIDEQTSVFGVSWGQLCLSLLFVFSWVLLLLLTSVCWPTTPCFVSPAPAMPYGMPTSASFCCCPRELGSSCDRAVPSCLSMQGSCCFACSFLRRCPGHLSFPQFSHLAFFGCVSQSHMAVSRLYTKCVSLVLLSPNKI